MLAVAEHQRLRAAYARERKATFEAIRKSSTTTTTTSENGAEPSGEPDADTAARPSAIPTLHIGGSYIVSASAVDLCRARDYVTMGALLQGGVLAAETEDWEGSILIGERRVFLQRPSPDATTPNVQYRGLVLSGTARYRQYVEVSAGVLLPDQVETTPVAPPPAWTGSTRAFLTTAIPGTHLSHGIVLANGERPLATTYVAADDVRFWGPPIVVSGQVGYLDPTRQGFASTGVALALPVLRLGVDASAETNDVRVRHIRASGVLGGTHVMSSGGAHLSLGLRVAMSRYVGKSIEGVSSTGSAPGFEVGFFAGGGLPWFAMGIDARVGQNTPEQLAVLPASYGNGEGAVQAMIRITPHTRSLPSTFRGPFHGLLAAADPPR